MRRKVVAIFLAAAVMCSITSGCTQKGENVNSETSSEATSQTSHVEVEKQLFDVTLTLPSDFIGEDKTQEQLEENIKSNSGIKSVKLNEDGSATYVMTKKAHQEMVQGIADSIDEALKEMVGSEDYPNFVDISANQEYTEFTVKMNADELSLNEAFSVMAFYIYGGMYGAYNGEKPENIHVDFVNADTGEVIESSNSSDAGNS